MKKKGVVKLCLFNIHSKHQIRIKCNKREIFILENFKSDNKQKRKIFIFSHQQSLTQRRHRHRWSRHIHMSRGRLNQMIIHMVRHRPGMTLDFTLLFFSHYSVTSIDHHHHFIVKEESVKISFSLQIYVCVCARCDYRGVTATGKEKKRGDRSLIEDGREKETFFI